MSSIVKEHLSQHGLTYREHDIKCMGKRNWTVTGPGVHLSSLRTLEGALEAVDRWIEIRPAQCCGRCDGVNDVCINDEGVVDSGRWYGDDLDMVTIEMTNRPIPIELVPIEGKQETWIDVTCNSDSAFALYANAGAGQRFHCDGQVWITTGERQFRGDSNVVSLRVIKED